MENAWNAERHYKENTAGDGSSLDELLEQWRTATVDICHTVRVPASHLAQMNFRCVVRAHRNILAHQSVGG